MRTPMIVLASMSLASAVSLAQSPGAADHPQQLVGRVVDAACYLMHPDAASGKTHDECGMACAKRGVPLGIVNEADAKLYLDLAGGTRLLEYLHQRVRVTGTTEKKNEPLRLELPVSATNTMAVELDGGYYVVAIREISRAPGRTRN
jgi:hypothetical protein